MLKSKVICVVLLLEVIPRYRSDDINTESIIVAKGTDGKASLRTIITTLPEIDCGPGYYLDDLYDCQPCSPGTMDIPDCHGVDPCRLDPCKHGGTCDNVYTDMGLDLDNFTCHCPLPYTGPTCEGIDPCSLDPCKNGGTCSSVSINRLDMDNFTCDCPSPYIGPTCEGIDPCKFCENGGDCVTKNKSRLEISGDNGICVNFSLWIPVIIIAVVLIICIALYMRVIFKRKKKRHSGNSSGENPESSAGSDRQPIDPIDPIHCQEDLESDILEPKLQESQKSKSIQQHQNLPDLLSPHHLNDSVYNTPELATLLASNLQDSASTMHNNVYQSETMQPGFDTDEPPRRPIAEEVEVNDPILVDFSGCEDPRKPLLYE